MQEEQVCVCRALISAIITQAIKDVSEPLTETELALGMNLRERPIGAMRWLFGRLCQHYAGLVDLTHEAMIEGLIRGSWNPPLERGRSKAAYVDMPKIVQQRMRWYAESIRWRGPAR